MGQIVLINLAFVVIFCSFVVSANDSPGFFLKVAKNVPRLGRRTDPSLRNNGINEHTDNISNLLASGTIEQDINKRMVNTGASDAEREYSVVQPVSSNTLIELLEKSLSDNMNFVFWKDFDRALQQDSDLYAKVTSLGRKPDQSLKADLHFNGFSPTTIDRLYFNDLLRRGSLGGNGGRDYVYYNKGGASDIYAGKYDRYDTRYNELR